MEALDDYIQSFHDDTSMKHREVRNNQSYPANSNFVKRKYIICFTKNQNVSVS